MKRCSAPHEKVPVLVCIGEEVICALYAFGPASLRLPPQPRSGLRELRLEFCRVQARDCACTSGSCSLRQRLASTYPLPSTGGLEWYAARGPPHLGLLLALTLETVPGAEVPGKPKAPLCL